VNSLRFILIAEPLMLGIVISSEAFACDYGPSTFEEIYAEADLVFTGKAGKAQEIEDRKIRQFDLEIPETCF
jgi:hypothetical protein